MTSIGVRVAVVPFTRQLAALDHVAFFEGVLAPYLDIRATAWRPSPSRSTRIPMRW